MLSCRGPFQAAQESGQVDRITALQLGLRCQRPPSTFLAMAALHRAYWVHFAGVNRGGWAGAHLPPGAVLLNRFQHRSGIDPRHRRVDNQMTSNIREFDGRCFHGCGEVLLRSEHTEVQGCPALIKHPLDRRQHLFAVAQLSLDELKREIPKLVVTRVPVRHELVQRVHLGFDPVRVVVTLLINEIPDRGGLHQARQRRSIGGEDVPATPEIDGDRFAVCLAAFD
jgi:hypothetical protein